MRTFTNEMATAAVELEQMVVDYFDTLDREGGGSAAHFFAEDCIVDIGSISYKGLAAMKAFYEGIEARIHTEQEDGIRTARHGFVNFRVSFPEKNRATITILCVTFSGSGKPPLLNATIPSVVTDVRFECRRETDGQWRFFGYYGAPVFVGNDPFMTKSIVKQ